LFWWFLTYKRLEDEMQASLKGMSVAFLAEDTTFQQHGSLFGTTERQDFAQNLP